VALFSIITPIFKPDELLNDVILSSLNSARIFPYNILEINGNFSVATFGALS
jgi:hypothetical protein